MSSQLLDRRTGSFLVCSRATRCDRTREQRGTPPLGALISPTSLGAAEGSRSPTPRASWADSLDSGSWRGSGSGYGSGLGERPVFGETNSPARRRHLKDDFFSDIFQCEESACSSPRRMERDSLNSPSPVSRILSPTRPSPPIRSEAVSGGSLLPAQLRCLILDLLVMVIALSYSHHRPNIAIYTRKWMFMRQI
ncbi:uncharacterized protein A4U43_C03F27250 [Asparagus officinalis]|uniref:Uncharacterized protein n=1 Tax=Asparagus officinalis TaxID=4686 RepID=A0A5P1FG68_ASPOF|nr:uncharacterized protein A4U43_C03F27250 [Asparagus officinalis]